MREIEHVYSLTKVEGLDRLRGMIFCSVLFCSFNCPFLLALGVFEGPRLASFSVLLT